MQNTGTGNGFQSGVALECLHDVTCIWTPYGRQAELALKTVNLFRRVDNRFAGSIVNKKFFRW